MSNNLSHKITLKNWAIIFIIFLFFASPFFLAQWFYYHKGDAVPAHLGTMNHGKLIQPLISLNTILAPSSPSPSLKQHWTILYISTSTDSDSINNMLDKIYRVRLALGKDFSKVGELFGRSNTDVLTPNPLKINTILLSEKGAQQLLTQLKSPSGIFLVDPSGNIFMAYPDNIKSDDIYKDIRRLLSNQ